MKKIYYTLIVGLFIASFAYAQEVPIEEFPQVQEEVTQEDIISTSDNVIPAFIDVIPVKSGIKDQNTEDPEQIIEEDSFQKSFVLENSFLFESEDTGVIFKDVSVGTTTATSTTEILDKDTELKLIIDGAISIFIRKGDTVVFNQYVELYTEEETIEVTDMNNVVREIPANSFLALLVKADQESDSFNITKLQYYDSFGSFYLKCVEISGQEYCDFWQYLVNDFSPWTGIDQTTVSTGDSAVVYFGTPYQVVFSTDAFFINTPFLATAQQYNYQTNTWSDRTGVTLGVTVTNPNDPWTPLELMTASVDSNGTASFTIATTGEYMIGVKDDWYYPVYPIVVATSNVGTTTDTSTSTDTTGGSAGGGSSNSKSFDVSAALAFIKSLQDASGSYGGSELYSDWVAIAFGSAGESDSKLRNYLKSKNISSITTDNERRVMAILAMGDNPHDFGGKNYIQAIVDDFDGTQIGEKNLINDDIFGVLVLTKVGYDENDKEISKTIEFILSKQQSNGLWENSPDLTAAAIQALDQYQSVSGVSSALSKAKNALKNAQQLNGGWGDVYKTSWIAQAMFESGEDWKKDSKTVENYFADQQKKDGGVLNEDEMKKNRIWATSYVIPAALGKSWNDILNSVSKSKTTDATESNNNEDSSGNNSDTATTTDEIIEDQIIESQDLAATSTLALQNQIITTDIPTSFIQKETQQNETESVSSSTQKSPTKEIDSQNLAAVNQALWFKEWWAYVLGALALFGFGVKFILKSF